VAATTGGHFFRAEDGAQLQAIYADIDKLAPAKLDTLSWRPKLPLFQWPLGAAVVLGLALWLGLWLAGDRGTEGGASSCLTRQHPVPFAAAAMAARADSGRVDFCHAAPAAEPARAMGGVIAPHLLQHLIVQPGQGRGVNPLLPRDGWPGARHRRVVGTDLAARTAAVCRGQGAADDRARPEFVNGSADVAPTRLERAKQKIKDLLALAPAPGVA
jgi:hypothetical protein